MQPAELCFIIVRRLEPSIKRTQMLRHIIDYRLPWTELFFKSIYLFEGEVSIKQHHRSAFNAIQEPTELQYSETDPTRRAIPFVSAEPYHTLEHVLKHVLISERLFCFPIRRA